MAELVDTIADQVHGHIGSYNKQEHKYDMCEPCKVGNSVQPARGWCETCDELLCNNCFNVHCRHKIMKNHQIWSLEERANRKKTREFNNKCQEHKGKKLKYFCENHKELGCSQCFVNKHRLCSKVVCITEVCTRECEEFKAINLLYSKLEKRLNNVEEKAERNLSISGRQHDEAIAGIEDAGEKLKRLIDTLVREQVANVEMTREENVRNISMVRRMKTEVAEELSNARDMLVKGDNTQLFITMKHLQGEAKVLESKIYDFEQKNNVKEYEFVLHPDLAQILETVKEFGILKDAQYIKREKSTDEVVHELEVQRFLSSCPYALWSYRDATTDKIQMSTDQDIMLLNVLLFPCKSENMSVELTVREGEKCLINCTSTHVKSDSALVSVKVVNKAGIHGIRLQAGCAYDIAVLINGGNSQSGVTGLSTTTVDGVKFTFRNTTPPNRTGITQGQIPGFRFSHL